MHTTGFIRRLVLLTVASMAIPTGAAGASGPDLDRPVVPAPTQVGVGVSGLGGLDHIQVHAGTDDPHISDALPAAWVCIRGTRSETHTETRGAGEVEVEITHHEEGCSSGASIDYHFDTVAWDAAADAEIPTSVTVSRWEQGAGGSWELVMREERQATAVVDLTWSGEGPVEVSPPVRLYGCYAPGPLCVYAGVQIRRAASVAGSVRLEGLDATAPLPDSHPGWMEWGRIRRVI